MIKRLFRRQHTPVETLTDPPEPTPLERARDAFSREDWAAAVEGYEASIAGGDMSREAWLGAASAHERRGNRDMTTSYMRLINRLHPSTRFDSNAAFAVYGGAPSERETTALFFLDRADDIRSLALKRVSEAGSRLAPSAAPGVDNAYVFWDTAERPPIVQRCIQSMHEHLPADLTLHELNAHDMATSIELDPELLASIPSAAHRSDVLRLHLLSTRGGMWLDATCLLGDGFEQLANRVRREDFFSFIYRSSRIGNWFLWARPDSYRLQLIRATLDAWLSEGRSWSNYYMFHDIVEMLYWTDERYRAEWDAGKYMHPREALEINKALGRRVGESEWFDLRHRSPMNKLSWKFDQSKLNDRATGVARLIAELPPAVPESPEAR